MPMPDSGPQAGTDTEDLTAMRKRSERAVPPSGGKGRERSSLVEASNP